MRQTFFDIHGNRLFITECTLICFSNHFVRFMLLHEMLTQFYKVHVPCFCLYLKHWTEQICCFWNSSFVYVYLKKGSSQRIRIFYYVTMQLNHCLLKPLTLWKNVENHTQRKTLRQYSMSMPSILIQNLDKIFIEFI